MLTASNKTPEAKGRLEYVDRLRGLIMVVMALDHVRMFVARDHPSEFWGVALPQYHGEWLPFLTRLVTHFCAPGFCFLMGLSMVMFSQNRREKKGWSTGKVARYFLIRGGLLIVLQHTLENPAWLLGGLGAQIPVEHYGVDRLPGVDGPIWLHFGVLYTLGAGMVIWGALVHLRTRWVALITSAALLATPLLLPDPSQVHEAVNPLLRLLAIPGRTSPLQVYYPILPWLGVVGLGVMWGRLASRTDRHKLAHISMATGALAIGLFVLLRATTTVGSYHTFSEPGLLGLLNVTKYPPSPAYLLMTLGGIWIALGLLARFGTAARDDAPLIVFGQTAMGFYVAHLYLYGLCNFAFPTGAGLIGAYAVWIAGLIPLYYLARAWRGFKGKKPSTSLWRMF